MEIFARQVPTLGYDGCGNVVLNMWHLRTIEVRGLLEAALDLVFPAVCRICEAHRAVKREGYVCAECQEAVSLIRPPFCQRCGLPPMGAVTNDFVCSNCRNVVLNFSSARAAALANGFLLDVIHRYKYERALYFEPFLAEVLVGEASPVLKAGRWDMVVPVPLHPVKQREREFNQAELLAAHLAKALNLPLKTRVVRRIRPTGTQTHLSREERARNVEGAFAPCRGVNLSGARVILIDDVMTTCATTNACAKALRDAGAADVCVWTVARGQ